MGISNIHSHDVHLERECQKSKKQKEEARSDRPEVLEAAEKNEGSTTSSLSNFDKSYMYFNLG